MADYPLSASLTSPLLLVPLLLLSSAAALAENDVKFGGRLQIDTALYDEDRTELGSGTELRRARLFAAGNLDEDWAYKAQFDFAGDEIAGKDLFLRYSGFDSATVTLGNQKVPFSLDELTSSKYLTFMERALPNAFATGRRIGINVQRNAEGYTLAGMAYGQSVTDSVNDEGMGVAARLTLTPVNSAPRLVHVGLAAAWEEPGSTDAGEDTVRFRARPESHVTSTRLVATPHLSSVSNIVRIGLEAAAVFGPLSIQAEHMSVTTATAMDDYDFSGSYAFLSWFPGGEQRPYKNGVFGRVKAFNAWELGLRWSRLDLNDGAIQGGEEENLTLGVNFYVNPQLRFMLNYISVDAEMVGITEKPDIVQLRASFDF